MQKLRTGPFNCVLPYSFEEKVLTAVPELGDMWWQEHFSVLQHLRQKSYVFWGREVILFVIGRANMVTQQFPHKHTFSLETSV